MKGEIRLTKFGTLLIFLIVLSPLIGLGVIKHFFVQQTVEVRNLESNTRQKLEKPYVLITTYRHASIIDYGTFKEIAKIKCRRLSDIKIEYYKKVNRHKKWNEKIDKVKSGLEELNKTCDF